MPFPPVPDFHPLANPDAVITAGNVRFTVLTDRLLRLEYSREARFEDRPSQAFWHREQPVPAFRKTITNSSIDNVNASREPAATAGAIDGRVTRVNVVNQPAPRSWGRWSRGSTSLSWTQRKTVLDTAACPTRRASSNSTHR